MPAPRLVLHLRPATPPGAAAAPPAPEDWLERWTPAWESGPEGPFLDLTGTGRLLGDGCDGPTRVCRAARRLWPGVAGGVAPSLLAAALASRLAAAALASRPRGGSAGTPPGLLVVAPGGAPAFLAPFRIEVLADRCPREIRLLRRFGVRTLGDLQVVPRALLEATVGEATGAELAAEARGEAWRPLRGRRPVARDVVAARLERPLTGRRAEAALRRAVAVRAMLACPEGPDGWENWELRLRWGGEAERTARVPGAGAGTLAGWLALVEALWRRFPARRQGVTGLRLRAGAVRPPRAAQGCLFASAARGERLAAVWRNLRARSPVTLFLASERLLAPWGVHWTAETGAPVRACLPAPQKRVGGSGRRRRRGAGGAAGKPASSRG